MSKISSKLTNSSSGPSVAILMSLGNQWVTMPTRFAMIKVKMCSNKLNRTEMWSQKLPEAVLEVFKNYNFSWGSMSPDPPYHLTIDCIEVVLSVPT